MGAWGDPMRVGDAWESNARRRMLNLGIQHLSAGSGDSKDLKLQGRHGGPSTGDADVFLRTL